LYGNKIGFIGGVRQYIKYGREHVLSGEKEGTSLDFLSNGEFAPLGGRSMPKTLAGVLNVI
jgi:hypothetical protein